MAHKRNPLGPSGETVRTNVKAHRERLNLGYADLARRLDKAGRPIPVLGLSRIERGDRRVDADDLVGLAVALETSPVALLTPGGVGAVASVDTRAVPEVAEVPPGPYDGPLGLVLMAIHDYLASMSDAEWRALCAAVRPPVGE